MKDLTRKRRTLVRIGFLIRGKSSAQKYRVPATKLVNRKALVEMLTIFVLAIGLQFPHRGICFGHFETDPSMQYSHGAANHWGSAPNFNWHTYGRRNKVYYRLTGLLHLERPVRGHPRHSLYDHTVNTSAKYFEERNCQIFGGKAILNDISRG